MELIELLERLHSYQAIVIKNQYGSVVFKGELAGDFDGKIEPFYHCQCGTIATEGDFITVDIY